MTSILDFESKKAEDFKLPAARNSSLSIDQMLTQLEVLINEAEDLEGIFFLKNRSALMRDNSMAYIANFKGEDQYGEKLIDKKIKYQDFPRWQNISKNDDLAEIDISSNSKNPFNFQGDKTFLVSAVRDGKYNWGMLVCFAEHGKVWTKNQLKLVKSFSKLLCSTLHYFHQQEKDTFLMQNTQAKENKRNLIIEKLEQRIERKNQLIEKLKKQSGGEDKKAVSASFKWSQNEEDHNDFDEVWVTVHGYKSGDIEPKVSKWEKVIDQNLLSKVSELFFPEVSKKQAM